MRFVALDAGDRKPLEDLLGDGLRGLEGVRSLVWLTFGCVFRMIHHHTTQSNQGVLVQL